MTLAARTRQQRNGAEVPSAEVMMSDAAGKEPLEQVTVNAEGNRVAVRFEHSLYPLDSIYGAAYVFIDRCYVFLDAPDSRHVQVELRGREPLSAEELLALGGEFANELLTQAWRHEITERNRLVIETVTLQALAGAAGLPPLPSAEGIEDLDLDDDVFDDPLGIATPWEEKYGKSGGEPPPGGAGSGGAGSDPAPDAKEDSTAQGADTEDPDGSQGGVGG